MSFRVSTVICLILFAASAFGLYLVKYQVQDLQAELAKREGELASEREAIHLLNAEWAYLTRPERLESLQKKHLSLKSISSGQTMMMQASLPTVELDEAPIVHDISAQPKAAGVMPAVQGAR